MTGYVACCCDPGFRIHIVSSLSINWTRTVIDYGETFLDEHFVGNQTLSVRCLSTQDGIEVWDMGSLVSKNYFSFGTIAESINGFVDLNQIGPGGGRRIPASPPIFFPGLSFWTVGIGDAGDCLGLNDGSIYARASLAGIADPGNFDNGSAGWSRTRYDFDGNPTGTFIRRGTPIQGNSPGIISVPMVSDLASSYRVLNNFPSSDADFVQDLGVFDPTPDAYSIAAGDFTDTTVLPEFEFSLDGINYGREAVQEQDFGFLCALRRCTEISLRYRTQESFLNRTTINEYVTTRNSVIVDYAIV